MQTCNLCKHLIGNRERTESWNEWGCGHPNNVEKELVNPVNGIPYKIYVIFLAKSHRIPESSLHYPESLCGEEGKWFEEYTPPQFDPQIGGQDPVELEVFDPATLEANRKKAEDRVAAIKAKKLSKDDLSNL